MTRAAKRPTVRVKVGEEVVLVTGDDPSILRCGCRLCEWHLERKVEKAEWDHFWDVTYGGLDDDGGDV